VARYAGWVIELTISCSESPLRGQEPCFTSSGLPSHGSWNIVTSLGRDWAKNAEKNSAIIERSVPSWEGIETAGEVGAHMPGTRVWLITVACCFARAGDTVFERFGHRYLGSVVLGQHG